MMVSKENLAYNVPQILYTGLLEAGRCYIGVPLVQLPKRALAYAYKTSGAVRRRAQQYASKLCFLAKKATNMCKPLGGSKSERHGKLLDKACSELLRFHKTTARFNAAIRKSFPPTHKLTKTMERNTSGLVNDAPGEVQSFVSELEDACFAFRPELARSFNDGVGETIEDARLWAGRPQIDEHGEFHYTARASWVETSLALEVTVAAAAFFASVCALPGVRVQHLRAEEKSYMHKYAAMAQEFQKAKFDPHPTDALLVSLLRRFPSDVCREIVEFVL